MMARTRLGLLGCLALAAACGSDAAEPVDATVATVEPVRGAVEVAGQRAAPTTRVGPGQEVVVAEAGITRLRLDGGARLLLDESARLSVLNRAAVRVESGPVFVEVDSGPPLRIETERGVVRAGNAALSIATLGNPLRIYVVRGEAAYVAGEHRGVAQAGEELLLGAGEPRVEASLLWNDWTGGLARPGVGDAAPPEGVGTLEARIPDETGLARWPLVARRLDVRVQIDGDYAVTEIDQIFFNPASETVEGIYRFRTPTDAVLQRFAVDRDGRLVDGYVRERAQAQQAYDAQVYRGSTDDPALLVWDAPGSYRARIYPIGAGETRRIVIRYAEWLRRPEGDGPRLYRYPMGGAGRPPHIQEFSLRADLENAEASRVRAGLGATVEQQVVMIRRSDFEPRADFWLELFSTEPRDGAVAYRGAHRPPRRAPGSRAITNEADERDYYFLPLVIDESVAGVEAERAQTIDLVIVADISAATDRSRLELGRTVVESLTAHLRPDDRVAIVTSDLTIRSVADEDAPALGPASPERLEALLDGLARVPAGGATDLGAAIAAAGELLDPQRQGAVVYVGDGAPTVGELAAQGLLQRMARLPDPVRLYALAVGASSNLDLLAALTRGGGLALRVEDRAGAADAALRVLAHASRPIARQVTVDLGPGIDNAFPRSPLAGAAGGEGQAAIGPVDVVFGEVLSIVGRVRDDVPRSVRVRGEINGRAFDQSVAVVTESLRDPTDLRLRWAGERLRQLLLDGEGREAVAELGTRCGLITPYTSYYVPSARELRQQGHSQLVDQPSLLDELPREHPTRLEQALAVTVGVALAPLTLTGCADRDEPPSAAQTPRLTRFEVEQERSGQGTIASNSAQEQPPAAPPTTEASGAEEEDEDRSRFRHRGEDGRMAPAKAARSDNRFGIAGPSASASADEAEPQAAEPVERARRRSARELSNSQDVPSVSRAVNIDGLRRNQRSSSAAGSGSSAGADEHDSNIESSEEVSSRARSGMMGALDAPTSAANAPADVLQPSAGDEGGEALGITGSGRGGGGTGEGTIGLGNLSTIGHGGGGGSGSGYGQGAGGLRGRRASVPTIRTGTSEVRGSLSRELIRRYIRRHLNQVRSCYEQRLASSPDLAGRVAVRFTIGATGQVSRSDVASSTLGNPQTEQCVAGVVRQIQFPAPEGGGVVQVTYPFTFQNDEGTTTTTTTTVTTTVQRWNQRTHQPRRCSDAADQPLSEREALWTERLRDAGSVHGWVRVYHRAIRDCEAPTWRNRRALLRLMVRASGGVARMIALHRAMRGRAARQYLRSVIFRRVRTPDDLRMVRAHFGVSSAVDWELIEQLLERARGLDGRIRVLRQLLGLYPRTAGLSTTYPDSFELKLRLLSALEEAGRLAEARRLAHELRSDPLADAGVRTTVGEMYLRLDDEAEARRVFSEIVEFAPYDAAARRRLGDLYRAHGWFEEAYRQYQTLAEIRPDDPSVSLLLAQAAAGAGRTDEAIRLEQRLAETAAPGSAAGLARIAILWSSVRFAKLRRAAREADDGERLSALLARMRRSGVLREAGALRISLTWSHPDAGLSLWIAHPGSRLTRPTDIAPEYGIEAFDSREVEPGRYQIEVRRQSRDMRTPIEAELVLVWNEGRSDERILVRTIRFEGDQRAAAWTLEGQSLAESELSEAARREVRR